ncbi:transcriptional regulator [Candidatus Geothermarchaeota archaeon]|nr:MAG: transcriptional regulator [Candidatus Geothermarchaeota archaeon]RLG62808.1 MAG: transcriptional regulator [Candidatus Geothermarchaeota archaeon]HEW94244.1 helix-turn-helix domain-containing protein [Thermoprotei archaeon]
MYEAVDIINSIKRRIYGDILTSNNVAGALRKWRNIFKVSQVELARVMGVSSSVVSEYENDPNKSPGTRFLRRYVESLIEIDMRRGGKIISMLNNIDIEYTGLKAILRIKDFTKQIPVKKFIKVLDADVLTGSEYVDKTYLYGYTVIDGIAAILSMSGESYYRIFGRTTERALIFINISTGRSPMVAVRVYPLKPRMVVLHGPKKVDNLAIRIAEREHVILALSRYKNTEDLLKILVDEIDNKYS